MLIKDDNTVKMNKLEENVTDLIQCFHFCPGADSGQISEETWNFLHSIYGGGPLVTVRPNISHQEAESSLSEGKIEVETRSI